LFVWYYFASVSLHEVQYNLYQKHESLYNLEYIT
jgi:hypothetical protein